VYRNDEITVEACAQFSHIVLSPGPGLPNDAGILMPLLQTYVGVKPLLGVCLGMQAIALHFGGKLYNQQQVKHGVTTQINHHGDGIFSGIPQQTEVALYHSWAVEQSSLPEMLHIDATSRDGVAMALRHNTWPVYGVQFHPESILTQHGMQMIKNWIEATR
jgi:anthranilate synthase component 2